MGTGDSGFESRRSDRESESSINYMFKSIVHFFDKLEDKIRGHLSRYPILYTIIGGIGIVLFWRGVWHTADMLKDQGGIVGFIFYEPVNLVLVVCLLLATGLFVSYFIGDTILISGLRKEKKLHEKTEREIREEEASLKDLQEVVKELKEDVKEIKEVVKEEQAHHHHEHGQPQGNAS